MFDLDQVVPWGRSFDECRNAVWDAASFPATIEQTRRNADEFVWESIPSVEELGQVRMAAMEDFLDDYAPGKVDGRYVDAELPTIRRDDRSANFATEASTSRSKTCPTSFSVAATR